MENLYKFRTWENKFHKRLLTQQEIFFSSISLLNDPFEATIPVRYDKLTKDEILQGCIDYLKYQDPGIKNSEARRRAKQQLKLKFYKDEEHLNWFHHEYQKEFRSKNFGIFSLTSNKENIVLWSHYADSHQGFCIGFNKQRLIDEFDEIYKQTGCLIELHKVGCKSR